VQVHPGVRPVLDKQAPRAGLGVESIEPKRRLSAVEHLHQERRGAIPVHSGEIEIVLIILGECQPAVLAAAGRDDAEADPGVDGAGKGVPVVSIEYCSPPVGDRVERDRRSSVS